MMGNKSKVNSQRRKQQEDTRKSKRDISNEHNL